MAKNDPSNVASLTIDDTRRDEFFTAIDQGLYLWMANEEKRTPKADRHAALCTASRQALELATDLIRLFARDRPNPKLVSVRVTSTLLRQVPHRQLRPAQVFYRWAWRIGEDVDPVRGTVEINGTTFLVRPILEGAPYSRERTIRVEVAELARSGRVRVIDHPVDEVVDINHPRRPNDPARLATTATEVVRLAEARDGRLAQISGLSSKRSKSQSRTCCGACDAAAKRHRPRSSSSASTAPRPSLSRAWWAEARLRSQDRATPRCGRKS